MVGRFQGRRTEAGGRRAIGQGNLEIKTAGEGALVQFAMGVRTVFFMGKPQPTGTLSLVEYLDGTYGILRDGKPVEGCRWQMGELDESISVFRDMDRRAGAEPAASP